MQIRTSQQFFNYLATGLLILAFLCIVLVIVGLQMPPRVLGFELRSSLDGSRQIVMNFSRNMDRRSVEENFEIVPKIEGKYSWSGRSFIFTPNQILPYGKQYSLIVHKLAMDEDLRNIGEDRSFMFSTPTLQFAYVGVDGEESGRLVLSDLKAENREILTPLGLQVDKFAVTADRQKIYFLGYTESFQTNHKNELYVFDLNSRQLRQITHDPQFLNKDFSLDPTGNFLLLSRVQVSSTGVYLTKQEAWLASTRDENFRKFLNGEAVGTIRFSPDGAYVLYKNIDGNYQIVPVDAQNSEDAVFVGNYDDSYGFHPFKPALVLTKYDNSDLFSMNNFFYLFTGNGDLQNLKFPQPGLVRDTVFRPDGKGFYSIFSAKNEVFDDKDSFYPLRIFHLYFFDSVDQKFTKITEDNSFSEEGQAVSPDSHYMIFQRYETFGTDVVIDPAYRSVTDSLGNIQSGGQIWIMDLKNNALTQLPVRGSDLAFLP